MGIKHSTTKAGGEIGYASEWNANHVIDGDVDFGGYDILNAGNLPLKTAVINIGDWNMTTTASKAVAHGLTLANIRSVDVVIRNDANDRYDKLDRRDQVDGLIDYIDATNVHLYCILGGLFGSGGWEATSYNRGWVVIGYV